MGSWLHMTFSGPYAKITVVCFVLIDSRRGSGFYSKLSLQGSDVHGVFTNNHVLGSHYEAENASATFGYEDSTGGVKIKLRPQVMFRTNKVSAAYT